MDGRSWSIHQIPLRQTALTPLREHHCVNNTFCFNRHVFSTKSRQAHCSAINVVNGLVDYSISTINCSTLHHVALICEIVNMLGERENKYFDNNLSDVKVFFDKSNSVHIMQYSVTCDEGWFKLDDFCVSLFRCNDCLNVEQAEYICHKHNSHLARHVLNSAIVTNNVHKDKILHLNITSKFALFWNMFSHKQDDDLYFHQHGDDFISMVLTKKIVVFVNLKEHLRNINPSWIKGAHLIISAHTPYLYEQKHEIKRKKLLTSRRDKLTISNHADTFSYLKFGDFNDTLPDTVWSLVSLPHVVLGNFILSQKYAMSQNYTLCEKSGDSRKARFVSCSKHYPTCDDGTCIHDSLVCDGYPHCLHGEDEENCEHICNDQSIDCITQCHYDDRCICSDKYFQCLSGGCIPLYKLCDQIFHCSDGSDEPATCVYIRPEELQSSSVSLEVASYVNGLIEKYNSRTISCLKHLKKSKLSPINATISYSPSSCHSREHSTDILVPCLDWCYYQSEEQFTSISNLCVYDSNCYSMSYCLNGFHLMKCEHVYCNGMFKCPATYCIPLNHVCNKVCDCPHCEEEKFCKRLLCPGLVLFPHSDSLLSCTDDVKDNIYKRQLIIQPSLSTIDDFPVFVKIARKSRFSELITKPEFIVYLKVNNVGVWYQEIPSFTRMVSIQLLDISNNNIALLDVKMFWTLFELQFFNLSNNIIKSVPKSFLCSFQKLKYIDISNNPITMIPSDMFSFNLQLKQIIMNNIQLNPLDVELVGPYPSLHYLLSDLPRFCCIMEDAKFCWPEFPTFMSCKNMISSKLQVTIAWVDGITTCCINFLCLFALARYMVKNLNKSIRSVIAMAITFNRTLSELICSVCLLSYSFFNVFYSGEFGIVADKWRHSIGCVLLESFFTVSAQASLFFAFYITLYFTMNLTSMIQQRAHPKRTFVIIMLIWLSSIVISGAGHLAQRTTELDQYNYFCFPFVTRQPPNNILMAFHAILLTLDILFVGMCILLNVYLFQFAIRHSQKTKSATVSKQTIIRKFAARMAVLILTSTVSWVPILVLQIIAMAGYAVIPALFLWVLLISFSFNLILDPILVLRNTMK